MNFVVNTYFCLTCRIEHSSLVCCAFYLLCCPPPSPSRTKTARSLIARLRTATLWYDWFLGGLSKKVKRDLGGLSRVARHTACVPLDILKVWGSSPFNTNMLGRVSMKFGKMRTSKVKSPNMYFDQVKSAQCGRMKIQQRFWAPCERALGSGDLWTRNQWFPQPRPWLTAFGNADEGNEYALDTKVEGGVCEIFAVLFVGACRKLS